MRSETVPVPNVCIEFNVDYRNTFQMLRGRKDSLCSDMGELSGSCPHPANTRPSRPASSPTRRRSAGRTCRGARPSSGAGSTTPKPRPPSRPRTASPYFDDLLDAQVRKLNPKYAEGPGALVGDLRRLHADIAGNRDFLAYLRNAKTFYDKAAGRELNLVLIDYEQPGEQRLRGDRGVLLPQRQARHARGRRLPHQRHPRAGDRVQERDQGRGHRAGRRSGPPLSRRDAGAVRAADGLHRHRGDRLFLRRHVEPDPPQHLQLEARAEGEPGGEGQELLRPRARAGAA